jgi:hypothetical protein
MIAVERLDRLGVLSATTGTVGIGRKWRGNDVIENGMTDLCIGKTWLGSMHIDVRIRQYTE